MLFRCEAVMVFRVLQLGVSLEHRDDLGRTPLLHACKIADEPKALALLEKGASVAAADNTDGATALHLVAWTLDDCADGVLLRALVQRYGMPVDVRDADGWTPLHWASAWGRSSNARVLLGLGADAAARSNGGRTPLHVLATLMPFQGNDEVLEASDLTGRGRDVFDLAKALVAAGADMGAVDEYGETPLEGLAEPDEHLPLPLLALAGAGSVGDDFQLGDRVTVRVGLLRMAALVVTTLVEAARQREEQSNDLHHKNRELQSQLDGAGKGLRHLILGAAGEMSRLARAREAAAATAGPALPLQETQQDQDTLRQASSQAEAAGSGKAPGRQAGIAEARSEAELQRCWAELERRERALEERERRLQ